MAQPHVLTHNNFFFLAYNFSLSRYHSLVRRLLEYTVKEHPDHVHLFEAFTSISKQLEGLDNELASSGIFFFFLPHGS